MAVAEEVQTRGGEVLFVGTSRGIEARVLPPAGWALELLQVSGLKRVGGAAFLRGLGRLPLALGRSVGIVRRFRPDVVLGVGGYASGPVVLAAALMGTPTAILEQNSVPGFTNRTLGRFVRAVFTAFPAAAGSFPAKKVRMVGNPVRRRFLAGLGGAAGAGKGVLVVGGSQGARAVNELVLGAAEILAATGTLPALEHQTGAGDFERCRDRYRALGLEAKVKVEAFIDDMPAALAAATVVVGRAGALTLAELAIVGRPAILIPLPTATDDHQTKNAEAFAAAGAAHILAERGATPARLAESLVALLSDAAKREEMAAAMRALSRPTAAADVVNALEALSG
jgi:UDP-N-acetylglucosamine--N-acetylmuramyl-(pentapeptide) pyrophosphoryl-undecaprenol N-acetylglucosamine transferase